jgi:hypothetical protein
MSNKLYYIYVNSFWSGFVDKTDSNHIEFFENLLKNTKLKNFEITNDFKKANILFESHFGGSLTESKNWEKKIFFSGENYPIYFEKYDIILCNFKTHNNIIDLPLFLYYIHGNNFMNRLLNRHIINTVPQKFCCFIVSNGGCQVRNKMFEMLSYYKKVDSLGKFNNNAGYVIQYDYWTNEYLKELSKYKFIICFENSKNGTYITEKIANGYLANIIPIYWSTQHIKNIFNEDSMLFLEDENNHQCYIDICNRVVELDNDDSKYLEFINRPIINKNTNYLSKEYSIDTICKNIDNLL